MRGLLTVVISRDASLNASLLQIYARKANVLALKRKHHFAFRGWLSPHEFCGHKTAGTCYCDALWIEIQIDHFLITDRRTLGKIFTQCVDKVPSGRKSLTAGN